MLTPEFLSVVAAQTGLNYCLSTFLLLPKYLATQLSATPSSIGSVSAIQGVVAVIAVPFVAGWVDRVGRKPLMAAGVWLSLFYALSWLTVRRIDGTVYALQVVSGLAFILTSSASSTLIADLAPPERLGQAIGLYGAANIAMNALAPALAEPIAARFGWHAAFLLAALGAGIALVLTRRIRELDPGTQRAAGGHLSATLSVARKVRPYLFTVSTCGASLGAVFTFYQPCVLAQGGKNVSVFFVGFMLAAVGTRLGLGSLADRVGRRRVALRAYSAYALAVLAMSQLTPELLFVLGFVFGCAHGFFYPALNALTLENVQIGERGRVMTLISGAFQLGNTLSVLAFGWIAHRFGYAPMFALAALVTCSGLFVLYGAGAGRAAVQASATR